MRVLIAPDSFKGSVTAAEAAANLRRGWLDVRPGDTVSTLPLADGGEGTLAAVAAGAPAFTWQTAAVDDPAEHGSAPWLLHDDGTAVVELAVACGLPMWPGPEPLSAHTYALGQVLRAAATDTRVRRLVVALGGSASTDGGSGALRALGVSFTDASGSDLSPGGATLSTLARVDRSRLVAPPRDGVELLVDVDAPLLGRDGAAAQFGPQKGGSPLDVAQLEAGLERFATVLGGDATRAGSGAAGGTAFGLAAVWGASLVPGSSTVADLVGLPDALHAADLVITGEGCLDAQSLRGKVVGHVADAARLAGVPAWACVGRSEAVSHGTLMHVCVLVDIAGSTQAALDEPQAWLREAGRRLADRTPRCAGKVATS